MPRSVNAVASRRRRKRIMNLAKGYYGSRSKVYTVAKNTVEKGLQYAYRDRKTKKREFRALWIQRINADGLVNELSVYLRPYPAVTVLRNRAKQIAHRVRPNGRPDDRLRRNPSPRDDQTAGRVAFILPTS